MTERDTTQVDDDPDDAECRHLWVSDYDGIEVWSQYRGQRCAWCDAPRPDDDEEP